MSVAGQGILTGPESADILSQALLQTGVSNGVKLEAENFSFDIPSDNLLSCDVQTLTNDLISKLDDNPTPENMLPTPALGSGAVDSRVQSSVGVSMCSGVDSYSYSGTKNGLIPPQQTGLVTPALRQPAMYDTGNSASYGSGADIELEDLLAIDVDPLNTEMYEAPSNPVAQNYPVSSAITQQTSFPPIPAHYGSYQSSSSNQGLPELANKDLLDIFGEEDFLDSLMEPSNHVPYIPNKSGLPEGQQQQQQAGFGGPLSYAPSPPNARPYNTSSSQMSTATLSPAYNGNSRQFQQPVATNRASVLQQQMYQKLQGRGRAPTTSPTPNRFPGVPVPRPFQIPGSSKMAAGAPELQVCCVAISHVM